MLSTAEKQRIISMIEQRLRACPEILFAYVHGSFVKGDGFRDVDVGIYTRAGISLEDELDLTHELSTCAGGDVDLSVLNAAPLPFQMTVLRDGKLLFSCDEGLRTRFIERVSRRFREYSHLRNAFLGIDGLRPE